MFLIFYAKNNGPKMIRCISKKLLLFIAYIPYNKIVSIFQILLEHAAEQLVAIQLADKASGIAMVGDVGRIFGKNVSDDLIDGIVALFEKRFVNFLQNELVFRLLIGDDGECGGLALNVHRHFYLPFQKNSLLTYYCITKRKNFQYIFCTKEKIKHCQLFLKKNDINANLHKKGPYYGYQTQKNHK